MYHFPISEIKKWDRFYRGNFINCLSGFKPVSLIGTINKEQQTNLAIFSNIFHLGADPALIGFINRPLIAAPHTLTNIENTTSYTINHIHRDIVAQAHQTSAKYDASISEFDATRLTPIFKNGCQAPFVAESHLQYSLSLVEVVPIKHNGTFMVIGALQDVYLNKELILDDGFIDLEKSGSIASLGIDAYYTCNQIGRFEYAGPNKPLLTKPFK